MGATSHAIPELDAKGLRRFGISTGVIVGALFGLFFPWLLARAVPLWPWVLSVILIVWGLVSPATLRPIYRSWMRFGLLMSRVTTPIILGLVFYAAVTPVAFIRRVFGCDDLALKLDDTAASYRMPSTKATKTNLERPF